MEDYNLIEILRRRENPAAVGNYVIYSEGGKTPLYVFSNVTEEEAKRSARAEEGLKIFAHLNSRDLENLEKKGVIQNLPHIPNVFRAVQISSREEFLKIQKQTQGR